MNPSLESGLLAMVSATVLFYSIYTPTRRNYLNTLIFTAIYLVPIYVTAKVDAKAEEVR